MASKTFEELLAAYQAHFAEVLKQRPAAVPSLFTQYNITDFHGTIEHLKSSIIDTENAKQLASLSKEDRLNVVKQTLKIKFNELLAYHELHPTQREKILAYLQSEELLDDSNENNNAFIPHT